ncbi:ABC transporter permease [Gluconacetobacter tumulisoli]|uniref:ABC transporter permease n=1 Tax=Gluconacetobacter tumulisoli TaxID=1286189 RepID=A0A7W4K9X3_9PROT|nr:ABC transporter permease [Gluconacetobacter tumulisoli]MBB2203038.1 ABC transporter permease [Gluconacetobacter tumulisoli]
MNNPLLRHMLRHRGGRFGLAILCTMVVLVGAAPLFAGHTPTALDVTRMLRAPSLTHPFGTDLFGRDVLARTLYGGRHTLAIGVGVVGIAFVAGVTLGTFAGFYGGLFDAVAMRLVDAVLSFPALVLAIALAAALGPGLLDAMLAISITMTPQFARLARSQAQRIAGTLYVEAARVIGVPGLRIMTRHVLRNGIAPLLTLGALSVGTAILQVASLGFLGLGAQPPTAEWGADIAANLDYVRVAPWVLISAGGSIMLTVLSFNLIADAIADYLNPRRQTAKGRSGQ